MALEFAGFVLDPANRRLSRDGVPVELSARYLDALALLASEPGGLITKDRFMAEVWRGVPVTDEALTQCIRSLRRALGDDAANPRLIETVPKHGYRFIAAVTASETTAAAALAAPSRWPRISLLGLAGAIGGGMAGLIGGLIYGFGGVSQPLAPGMGAASVLLVLLSLCIAVGMVGGLGVGLGVTLASRTGHDARAIGGGMLGGLVTGGLAKLLGLDAFALLLGRAPGAITGAMEGALLGAALGLGLWLGAGKLRRSAIYAALACAAAGLASVALGGRLMAGSLALLAEQFPDSRLRLDRIGALLGEDHFGQRSLLFTGALEGLLFGACLAAALTLARRDLARL